MKELFANPWFKGAVIAGLSFSALGTVSALWDNPLFIRMVPADGWEIFLLAMMAVLFGVYVAIREPVCAALPNQDKSNNRKITLSGIIGFVGVACPVCNKILLYIFGGELLLVYFEPVRIYVALVGVIAGAWVVWRTWIQRQGLEQTTGVGKTV